MSKSEGHADEGEWIYWTKAFEYEATRQKEESKISEKTTCRGLVWQRCLLGMWSIEQPKEKKMTGADKTKLFLFLVKEDLSQCRCPVWRLHPTVQASKLMTLTVLSSCYAMCCNDGLVTAGLFP